MVELLNEPFSDLPRPNIDVGVYGHITSYWRVGEARQSGKTV